VRIRITPRTPKAGSRRVSRTIGSGVADAVAEAVELSDVEVGVGVTVTLKVVGTTVVNTETLPLDVVDVVTVVEAVVSESEPEGVVESVEELDD